MALFLTPVYLYLCLQFSSVAQSCPTLCNPMNHSMPGPCPSPIPGVYPNSCPLSLWCHPTISSSVVPFSSCPQSFTASGSFQMSQLLSSRWPKCWSFSFNISPSNEHPGLISFRMTGWISLQDKKQANTVPGKSPMAYFTLILNKGYFLNIFIDSI